MLYRLLRNISLAAIILIVASLALTQIPAVKLYIFNLIAEKLEAETGYTLTAKDIDLTLPFEVKIAGLTVAQGSKKLAFSNLAILRINPRGLIQGHLIFHYITFNDLRIERLPEAEERVGRASFSQDLTKLPLYISLPQLNVRNLTFAEGIIPNLPYSRLNVKGFFLLDPGKGISNIEVTLHDASNHNRALAFAADLMQSQERISLDAACTSRGGFIKALGPGMESEVSLNLTGEAAAWSSFLNGEAHPQNGTLSGSIDLDFSCDNEALSAIKNGHLTGNIELLTPAEIKISALQGNIDATEVSGNLHFDRSGNIEGNEISLKIDNLNRYNTFFHGYEIEGPLEASLKIQGMAEAPAFALTLYSKRLNVENATLMHPSLFLKGIVKDNAVVAEAQGWLSELGETLSLEAGIFWNRRDTLELSDVKLRHPKASIYGDASFNYLLGKGEGELNGNIENLQILEPFLNKKIGGKASWKAAILHSEESGQSIDFSAAGTNLYFEGTEIGELTASTEIANSRGKASGKAKLKARLLQSGGIALNDLELSSRFSPDNNARPFEASWRSADFNFNGEGIWFLSQEKFKLILEQGSGNLKGHEMALIQPVTFTAGKEAFDIAPLKLSLGAGELSTSLGYNGKEIKLEAQLDRLPLSLIASEVHSIPFEGSITALARLHGKADQLLGKVEMSLNDLVFQEETAFGALPIQGNFTLDLFEDKATFQGSVIEQSEIPIVIAATLPMKAMLATPPVIFEEDRPLSVSLKANGPLTPLLEFFPTDYLINAGEGEVQIDIGGTLMAPAISGTAALAGVSFESYEFGTILRGIEASFRGEGNNLVISKLIGYDSAGGSIEGHGEVSLKYEEGFPFELALNLSNLQLLRLDNAQARFNGSINLAGSTDKIAINGNLETTEARYAITKKIDEIARTVEVHYVNQDPSVPPPTKMELAPLTELPITFDILLSIPNNLHLFNEDFQSRWKGNIKISGDMNKLDTNGTLSIANGIYMLNGQQYEIRQGTITLAGNLEKKTSVYIVTSRDVDEYRIDIVLQGPIANPKVILRSSPPLPQQGVLSLILFGKVPSDITAYQDQQLEKTLSSLTKGSQGPGVINKIQKSIGVDRIDFKRPPGDDSDDMSIQVGKYLTRNIFISLNKGFGEEANKVALEAKLKNNFQLKIEAGDRSDSDSDQAAGQVSLIWKHDY